MTTEAQPQILAVITAITPILIALLKIAVPKIPKQLLPVIAPVVGVLVEYVSTSIGTAGTSWWLAAIGGSAGVGLRELYDQIRNAGGKKPECTGGECKKPGDTTVISLLTFVIWVSGLGCSAIAPGSDPIVVNAQRTMSASFDIVDAFLRWEHINRGKVDNEVTKAADDIRVKFPTSLEATKAVLRVYKETKSSDSKATLETWLATLREIESHARRFYSPVTKP
jgi:hypothetical protein